MKMPLETVLPADIERRSFEIIRSELPHPPDPLWEPVVLRVIHATADFDFADSLWFSPDALAAADRALRAGATIVTDTNMARAGVNRASMEKLGCKALCYMADEDVAAAAKKNGTTRAAAAVDKAAALEGPVIFAVGNAPTALVRLYERMGEGSMAKPALVIAAPVGFVNVVQAKELILGADVPRIVARGRKGGSAVAAAIVNALLYRLAR